MFRGHSFGKKEGIRLFSSKATAIGLAAVIIISISSSWLFFYLQELTEKEIRTNLFEQQKEGQIELTQRLVNHMGADLNLIATTIDGLANSYYMQQGDFHSDKARNLVEEKYELLNPRVNRLMVLDENNIVTISLAPSNLDTFLSADYSVRDWVIETRRTLEPVYSHGFERQGIYRIFISYPIVNMETRELNGIIAVSIPTVPFFAHYANVESVDDTHFLVVFDRAGTMLANGVSQDLVGTNFFDATTQDFINSDPSLNQLTRDLLDGNAGYGVYDYGRGERITTQSPIYVQGEPLYFMQLVTPTAHIYSEVNDSLRAETDKLFMLLLATIAAIGVLVVFLIKWNEILGKEVRSRTNELEEANKRLSRNLNTQREFLNIAAHELRTPVQPILGLAQVLQDSLHRGGNKRQGNNDEAEEYLSQDGKRLLGVIIRNANRLQKLTEDLLDVSRIEAQSLQLRKEPFELNQLIHNIADDLNSSLNGNRDGKGEQKIRIIARPIEEVIVDADRERIAQVITNLMNNAIKFTGEGTILIDTKVVDSEIVTKITDAGRGIDPQIMPRLFEKFATKSERGTGLGLFISKGIIEAHDGNIWAENNKDGPGATFSFSLPLP